MVLTEEGRDAGDGMGLAAVGLVFEYLNMLRTRGPQEWIWNEMKGITEMAFRFEEDEDALHVVTHLAESMLVYKPEDVLVGHYLFSEWDPELITKLLGMMTPGGNGMRVDLMTSNFDVLKEKFMASPVRMSAYEQCFLFSRIIS